MRLLFVLISSSLILTCCSAAVADPVVLRVVALDQAGLSPEARAAFDRSARQHANAKSAGVAQIAFGALAGLKPGERAQLNLGPDGVLSAETIATERLGESRFIWRARILAAGATPSDCALAINRTQATGSIHLATGTLFKVQPVFEGVNAIFKLDAGEFPPD